MSDNQMTCGECGKEMRHNVPRLGDSGGFVHADTGSFLCDSIKKEVSNTPRTDENALPTTQGPGVVLIDFSRELERENNRLREEIIRMRETMHAAVKLKLKSQEERDNWKSCAEELAKNIKRAEKGFRNPAYGREWDDMADDLLECLETFNKLKGEQ